MVDAKRFIKSAILKICDIKYPFVKFYGCGINNLSSMNYLHTFSADKASFYIRKCALPMF